MSSIEPMYKLSTSTSSSSFRWGSSRHLCGRQRESERGIDSSSRVPTKSLVRPHVEWTARETLAAPTTRTLASAPTESVITPPSVLSSHRPSVRLTPPWPTEREWNVPPNLASAATSERPVSQGSHSSSPAAVGLIRRECARGVHCTGRQHRSRRTSCAAHVADQNDLANVGERTFLDGPRKWRLDQASPHACRVHTTENRRSIDAVRAHPWPCALFCKRFIRALVCACLLYRASAAPAESQSIVMKAMSDVAERPVFADDVHWRSSK
eukprot:921524-Prymnesium_polylepis.2